MDFSAGGTGRVVVGLGILALVALSAWLSMDPGKFRSLVWVLMGFFAFRVLLIRLRRR